MKYIIYIYKYFFIIIISKCYSSRLYVMSYVLTNLSAFRNFKFQILRNHFWSFCLFKSRHLNKINTNWNHILFLIKLLFLIFFHSTMYLNPQVQVLCSPWLMAFILFRAWNFITLNAATLKEWLFFYYTDFHHVGLVGIIKFPRCRNIFGE